MIDLHCHLLPGIDDGAQTLDESLELARLAVADGIKHTVCTPHINIGRFDNDISTISVAFEQLQQALVEQDIPLTISMAAEVRISPEMMFLIEKNKIPFVGIWQGKKVLLLEMPHSHIPPGSDKLVKWLLSRDILPMIAHPERNRDVQKNPALLRPFVQMGCLFQLTASSLTGAFGETSQTIAIDLLKEGKATVIATDAHNVKRRPPFLQEGVDAAAKVIGLDAATKLVLDNPLAMIESAS